jgi:cytochrome P450 family 2 subfamily D
MAWKPMVVINGLKAMKEVLLTCGEDTADSPPVPIYEHRGKVTTELRESDTLPSVC